MSGPPRFLICRCGEAFPREQPHVCRSKEIRERHFPTLRSRWNDPRLRAQIMRALEETGMDPAFAPGAEQREFLND